MFSFSRKTSEDHIYEISKHKNMHPYQFLITPFHKLFLFQVVDIDRQSPVYWYGKPRCICVSVFIKTTEHESKWSKTFLHPTPYSTAFVNHPPPKAWLTLKREMSKELKWEKFKEFRLSILPSHNVLHLERGRPCSLSHTLSSSTGTVLLRFNFLSGHLGVDWA